MTTTPSERPDPNQLLLTGGKAPEAADFGQVPPSTVSGTLLSGPTSYHAREYDAKNPGQGALRYWPDNNPVYGVYLDLDIPGVGLRRLYVEKLRMTTAIQQAMLRAGVRKVAAGGRLSVMWTGTEAGAGNLPANTYYADYIPPSANAASSGDAVLANGGGTTPVHQPAQQWQAQQPVPAMATGYATPPIANYVPPQMFAPQPAPAPAPVQQQPAPIPAPQQPTAPVQSAPVLTETIAAAMRNAGLPTDGYTIVPG